MKKIGRVKRPYVYLIAFGGGVALTWLLSEYVVFDISLEALRLLAIAILGIAGVLIGLVATIATSILRVATSQKQFYQGMLVSEGKWLRDWFVRHPLSREEPESGVKEILRLVYRHSGVAACSEEETVNKVAETLLPLVEKWRKAVDDTPNKPLVGAEEIDEFVTHLEGMVGILDQIKTSKSRIEVGAAFGEVLWFLGFTILVALGVLVYTGVPSAAQHVADEGYLLVLILVLAAFIPVGVLIWFTTQYLRMEAREIKYIL